MSRDLDDPVYRELVELRDRVNDLEEECRQLRLAQTPISAYPASWRITPSESRLLHALHRAKGGALSKERILVQLYGFEVDVEPKIVDVMVCKMRKKLAPYGIEIMTHWGSGYGLTLESLPIIRDAIAETPAPAMAA